MRSATVVLAALLGLLLVGALVRIGASQWDALSDAPPSDQILGRAAIIQAGSSLLALVVTAFVAVVAFRALSASRQANVEVRVERELSVLPVLSAIRNEAMLLPDGRLRLRVSAKNWTDFPAVRVEATVHAGPWDPSVADPASSLRVLGESPRTYEVLPREEDKGKLFTWIVPADHPPEIVVRLSYLSPLGAEVWQTYELRGDERSSFVIRERVVRPATPGAERIVTRYRVGWDGDTG